MHIKKIDADKKRYLDLLLLADEQEDMIDRYLAQGEMYVLYEHGEVIGEAVIMALDEEACEIKNVAVRERFQGQGYGRVLIDYLAEMYAPRFSTMYVGTGDVPSALGFYARCGFTPSHRVKNFFTDNYDAPIIEDGVRLVDMVYLRRKLR